MSLKPTDTEYAHDFFTIEEENKLLLFTPTHRINLAQPRFTWHENRREWYVMMHYGAKFFCEFIVRQSYGHPGDCYYATKKVKFVTHAEVN